MSDATTAAFVQYGALGAITLVSLFAVRHLFAELRRDMERETQRADRHEQALRELNAAVQERIIPAALDMVGTTKALIELMAQERERARRRPREQA